MMAHTRSAHTEAEEAAAGAVCGSEPRWREEKFLLY